MEIINQGDRVSHKNHIYNNGLSMNVIDTSEDKSLCEYFNDKMESKEEWFNNSDLHLVEKSDGGFTN
jgi:hypothetical protein